MLGQLGLISLNHNSNLQDEELSNELEELNPQSSIQNFPPTMNHKSSNPWEDVILANTHGVISTDVHVKGSQIGPDGNLYVFGVSSQDYGKYHQFGSQTINYTPGNTGYFAVKMNMFRGWAYAFEGGGGNYSASPSLISVDRNGNYHISIVGGNGSSGSSYFQEFPDFYGSNSINCTQNAYLLNYTYNQSTGISMSNCSQTSNITDMVYVNSTLVTSQAPVLSLAYDHNSGILYQFGMQTNTSSGCLSFRNKQLKRS